MDGSPGDPKILGNGGITGEAFTRLTIHIRDQAEVDTPLDRG